MITILEKIGQYHEILQHRRDSAKKATKTDRPNIFFHFLPDFMELTKGGILLQIRHYIRAVNALQ
ncbi:MAG: hypothetical protein GY820_40200 [Gammaproteobacteria bacterium]|nr:hypothetical protein [Gammaproteobacteria bacterium]